jgi:hypothetical protein
MEDCQASRNPSGERPARPGTWTLSVTAQLCALSLQVGAGEDHAILPVALFTFTPVTSPKDVRSWLMMAMVVTHKVLIHSFCRLGGRAALEIHPLLSLPALSSWLHP